MDTKQLLKAKKELENRLLVVINKELDAFHEHLPPRFSNQFVHEMHRGPY